MDMRHERPCRKTLWSDDSGIAMVLAVSLTALLTILGMYLLVESGTTYRMTQSLTRHEQTFNLAEAALQLSRRCLYEQSNETLLVDVEPGTLSLNQAYMASDQSVGSGHESITPEIDFLESQPVPGWDISKFMGYYYLARGQGTIPMPEHRGDAGKEVMSLFQKVGQVRTR